MGFACTQTQTETVLLCFQASRSLLKFLNPVQHQADETTTDDAETKEPGATL